MHKRLKIDISNLSFLFFFYFQENIKCSMADIELNIMFLENPKTCDKSKYSYLNKTTRVSFSEEWGYSIT